MKEIRYAPIGNSSNWKEVLASNPEEVESCIDGLERIV